MSAARTGADLLARLDQALAAPGVEALREVVPLLESGFPTQPFTLFARAELAQRSGDPGTALNLSATALAGMLGPGAVDGKGTMPLGRVCAAIAATPPDRLASLVPFVQQFGTLMQLNGLYRSLGAGVASVASAFASPQSQAGVGPGHAQLACLLLAFDVASEEAWCQAVFDGVVLPWIETAAAAGRFDTAFALEACAYGGHVKRRESQQWFQATAGRWIAPLSAHARRTRGAFAPVHERWRPQTTRRVAFLVHAASLLAHVELMLQTLEAAHRVGTRDFAFTVFVLGGRDDRLAARLAACGVELRYLESAGDDFHARLVRLQQALREGNFVAVFWISLVMHMAAAFGWRIAPVQGWWAMKYHAYEVPDIDARLAVENVVLEKNMEGHAWLTLGTAKASWVDPARAPEARALRRRWPADAVVAACVGREDKIDSPDFLDAVCALLERHPNLLFLWTGKVRRPGIQEAFERRGVAGRTEFVGWVDTPLYAQAIDLFLDSFPFPCGFSIKEAMAAGKPAVMFVSPESLETGVAGSLWPAARGEGGVPAAARERLRALYSRNRDFDLLPVATTAAEYVEAASRLVADAGLREATGAAHRGYIEAFCSSPEDEARKFLDHLETLCAAAPREAP